MKTKELVALLFVMGLSFGAFAQTFPLGSNVVNWNEKLQPAGHNWILMRNGSAADSNHFMILSQNPSSLYLNSWSRNDSGIALVLTPDSSGNRYRDLLQRSQDQSSISDLLLRHNNAKAIECEH